MLSELITTHHQYSLAFTSTFEVFRFDLDLRHKDLKPSARASVVSSPFALYRFQTFVMEFSYWSSRIEVLVLVVALQARHWWF